MASSQLTEWLQTQLLERHWGYADFGRAVGTSTSGARRWAIGETVPSPVYCDKIAHAFGVPVDMVLELAGHKAAPSDQASIDPTEAYIRSEAARLAESLRKLPRALWPSYIRANLALIEAYQEVSEAIDSKSGERSDTRYGVLAAA